MPGREPSVKLISHTMLPVETLEAVWRASRETGPIPPTEELAGDVDLFQKIMSSKIPVAQMIDVIFLLEDVSISFREQTVRHKIGTKVGDKIGVDTVPDLTDSTWWSQSMRVLDMGRFASEDAYFVPDSVSSRPKALERYVDAMRYVQAAYNDLVIEGVPREDARNVIPLGAGHRIVWKLNLGTLMHVIGHRGCWILQLGFWGPIIKGMVEALATEIHPVFRDLISPPCMKGDKFTKCAFELDNEKRLFGEDPLPPCSLWIGSDEKQVEDLLANVDDGKDDGGVWLDSGCAAPSFERFIAPSVAESEQFKGMQFEYGALWGRDPWTGIRQPEEVCEVVEDVVLEDDEPLSKHL